MGSLQNKIPAETYPGLLHIENDSDDAQTLDGTLRVVEDGTGVDSILSLSTTQALIGGVNFIGSTMVVDFNIREDLIVSGNTFGVNHSESKVGINVAHGAIRHDLEVSGDIGFSGDIIHAGDDNTYISPFTDGWDVYTGGTKRLSIDNDAVTTMDVNFIAQSDSTVSPYPLFTSEANGFVGIGNQQLPVNLLHLKVLGANVDDGHKGGEDPSPEEANWMRNTFICIENTFTSDGNTGESDDYMFNVSTGIKGRQKVHGSSDVFTTGMLEFSPRPASVTNQISTQNAKMDIWLAASAGSPYMWRRMLGVKAYGYDILDVTGGAIAYNYESVLCVGPDSNTQYGGYISTIGSTEDEDSFRHPMHYTDIDTDDTDGSDMGIQDKNFCESLNLTKTHVWRGIAGETTVKNGYAAGICLQPKYGVIYPADDLTITNHNYISILNAGQGSPGLQAITKTNLFNFDFDPDFDGDADAEGSCIRPATTIGAHAGSIYITIGGNGGTQTQYLIPFYAVPE